MGIDFAICCATARLQHGAGCRHYRVVILVRLAWLALFFAVSASAANVTDYGAIPDDGLDDRGAIQAAIDAGGEVVFPPGVYDVGRSGFSPWALDVGGTYGLSLVGSGAVLRQMPSAPSTRLISSQSAPLHDLRIIGLTLDGNKGAQSQNEQRHGIFLRNASNVRIFGVTAQNFTGDGIYLHDGSSDVSIEDCSVRWNDRNGITVGGSVSGLRVNGCDVQYNGNQQFDSEANPGDIIEDVSITDNTFVATTDYAVTLGGVFGTPGTNWRVTGNRVKSNASGIRAIYADGIVIHGNTIESGADPYSGIQVYNWNDNVVISSNVIKSKSTKKGAGISVIGTTMEKRTERALIIGNQICGDIRVQGAKHTLIDGNFAGLAFFRATLPMESVSVTDNHFDRLSINGSIDSVCVSGNIGIQDSCL